MALGYPYYIIRSSLSKSWTNSSFLKTYIVRAFFFVAFLAFAVVVDGQAPGVSKSVARLVLMWLILGSAKVNSFLNMAIEECTGQENCNKGSPPSLHLHQLPHLGIVWAVVTPMKKGCTIIQINHQMNQEKTAQYDNDSKYGLQFQQKSRWMPTGGGYTRYQAILIQISFNSNPSGWLRYESFLKRREERQTATMGISGTTHSVLTLQLAMQTVKWVIT